MSARRGSWALRPLVLNILHLNHSIGSVSWSTYHHCVWNIKWLLKEEPEVKSSYCPSNCGRQTSILCEMPTDHRGHLCIRNSSDRLQQQFPPSSCPLKLSTRITFVLYYFLSDEHTFYFFTCVFKFQLLKLLHEGGQWRWWQQPAKFPPSTSFPLPLLFYLLIITVFRCMSCF